SAAEEIGYTFLPCVLAGLSKAPQFGSTAQAHSISAGDVDTLVVPASALGGSAVLSLSGTSTQILAVQDNTTALAVDAAALGLRVITVRSYLEAMGAIAAQRAGVSLLPFTQTMARISPLSAT
ncbi:MAG: DUF3326 domain-containing protein, partial [Cyanobacteria bacterium J06636_28]